MSGLPSSWRARIAEGTVITLSIVVAFAIDAWWDGVQQAEDDRSHLENVRRELEAADELLDDAIRLHALSETLALEVLEMTSVGEVTVPPDSLDTLVARLFNSYVINPPIGALQAAIMSGAVARLPDDVLRSQLLGWNSLLEDLLEEEQNGYDGTLVFMQFLAERVSVWGPTSVSGSGISGEIIAETPWVLPPSRHSEGVATLVDDQAFENHILILLGNARASYDEATAFQTSLHDALGRLNTVLQ
jgi:hypothetical protein